MRTRWLVLALAAGLALADGSIVTLALPQILRELDTTVEGVAAVIGVYTLVIAVALLPLERAARTWSLRAVGAGGFALMAIASLACAAADDLTALLVARGAQALGGAAGLVAAFALIGGDEARRRRTWVAAAVVGTAVGPALGGALTQVFSWQAIFVFQAPLAAAAAVAAWTGPAHVAEPTSAPAHPKRFTLRPALGLALVSAALSAVLFLLVLLLVAGWSISPLGAAAAVSVIPLGALAGTRVHGDPHVRAAAGSALLGGGVLALAWLPTASVAWTLAPEVLAGFGMGLALPALAGGLLPERTTLDVARTLALRHAGIAAALALLAPIVAHQLTVSTEHAREQGVALLLDAPLPLQDKIGLAPELLAGVDTQDPRDGLNRAVELQRGRFQGEERATYDRLGTRLDETLTSAVGDAFQPAFLITGGLALLAGVILTPWGQARRAAPALAGAAVIAVLSPAAYAAADAAFGPEPVAILDPCTAKRKPPSTGGITGFVQDRALQLLDKAACRLGSSREELVLALSNETDAKRFENEHGVDPRSILGLLEGLFRGGP
ncbi:MAG TPA: MFS transporter [Thermoleophilaceae bacterium]